MRISDWSSDVCSSDLTDGQGRMVSYGRVAAVAVVGNEDGAHHISAELYQALNDVGFTLAANAVSYWVGEAMQKTNYNDPTGRASCRERGCQSVSISVVAGSLKKQQR